MIPITGLGAVASVGDDVDRIFTELCAAAGPGPRPLRGFTRDRYTAQRLFEIDNRQVAGEDEAGRATDLLLDAVAQAAGDAGLGEDLSGIPVLVGTGLRELRSLELWWRDGVKLPADRLHFGTALRERFGVTDAHTISNACSASLYALALGADLIDLGDAETVVVAGTDVVTESMFGLADRVQPTPPDAVRPFDRQRRGTILGEGAAAVVLRREPVAGRPAQAWLRGVAIACDAGHVTAPDRSGVARTIREAHRLAGARPEEIDLVLMHATGTTLNDRTEAAAMTDVYGSAAGRPLVTGIKSLTGHTSGSAGLLSLIVAVRSLHTGRVPPIAGLRDPIEEAAPLRLVRGEAVRYAGRVAQVNGFGFGGINAVAVVEDGR